MRGWLRPLVPLYRAGQALENTWRGAPRRLRGKVISIGSLSAGGAGKTPVVILVANMLRDAGFAVDVLSRGYGRTGTAIERVDPSGSAVRFGDEPMLLARRLGAPVWVGADRYLAGLAAESSPGDVVHVLDDGFQHRRLHRDVDLVLLTRQDAEDRLLPAGNLREELGALERASIVVLREEEDHVLRPLLPPGKPVWVVRRSLRFDGEPPGSTMAFCALARPEGFLTMLTAAGLTLAGCMRFRDHHAYSMRDMTRLITEARQSGAKVFCTTEKDAVKLTGPMMRRLEQCGRVSVAKLQLDLVGGHIDDLLRLIQ